MEIRKLDAAEAVAAQAQLRALMFDTVAHGNSLGFLANVGADELDAYWRDVAAAVAGGSRVLLVALDGETVVGTAQLDLCQRANGRNRAEVQKVMVHSSARRRGIGGALLRALEGVALELERGLLFLDTEAGSGAERLYLGQGYVRVGELPEFACSPDGQWHATAIYYKTLFSRNAR